MSSSNFPDRYGTFIGTVEEEMPCARKSELADHGISPAKQSPAQVETTDERLRRLESLQRDTDAEMGHRIELLREKVEALELSIGTAHNEAASDRAIVLSLEQRLDAALKRIEELERARPTRPENVWKNDPALTVTHVDTERGVVTLERKP